MGDSKESEPEDLIEPLPGNFLLFSSTNKLNSQFCPLLKRCVSNCQQLTLYNFFYSASVTVTGSDEGDEPEPPEPFEYTEE